MARWDVCHMIHKVLEEVRPGDILPVDILQTLVHVTAGISLHARQQRTSRRHLCKARCAGHKGQAVSSRPASQPAASVQEINLAHVNIQRMLELLVPTRSQRKYECCTFLREIDSEAHYEHASECANVSKLSQAIQHSVCRILYSLL